MCVDGVTNSLHIMEHLAMRYRLGHGCLQSLDWTGLDWTGLDWTTGLSLKLTVCQYINTHNVFVQLINGAYSYAACPGIILCCH